VQTVEAGRRGQVEVLELDTEPASWQQSLSPLGVAQMLKPDLRLVTVCGDYEEHWFIEADMASEHLPVILRQCAAYEAFRATGRYQAVHGLFPAVLWVTPTEARAAAIRAAVGRTAGLGVPGGPRPGRDGLTPCFRRPRAGLGLDFPAEESVNV
jgi:hypothetical protein